MVSSLISVVTLVILGDVYSKVCKKWNAETQAFQIGANGFQCTEQVTARVVDCDVFNHLQLRGGHGTL